jgi:hypothetical protein
MKIMVMYIKMSAKIIHIISSSVICKETINSRLQRQLRVYFKNVKYSLFYLNDYFEQYFYVISLRDPFPNHERQQQKRQ